MEKMKVKNFSWVDHGQSKRVDWWEINIELVLNDKNYNLNIIKESYLDGDDSKGSDYRIKDNNGNILYDGLWVKLGWSRYDELETKGDWMIGDENGLDVWLKIEEEIENDNGWGIWNVEVVNENYLKELFSNTNSDNSVKTEKEILVKEETINKKGREEVLIDSKRLKILEFKCFGVDDSMVKINDLYQHILFKINNGNYIYKKIHNKSDSGVVSESPLYYTDEDSYNLENYQNTYIFDKGIRIYQRSNDGGIFDKVSYDETKLVERYYREHNLELFDYDKVQLFEIKKPYTKCDLEYVRLIGVISRDEYECETEIDTQIVVRFGLKSGETISVNRVITEVNNKRIRDNFYYSKRDNIDDGGRRRVFIFSDNIWSTKEVFEKDNKELGKYCDYLNYLHCGFEKTFDRYDYYLGNNWTYNNDENSDLDSTNSIVEWVEEDFN